MDTTSKRPASPSGTAWFAAAAFLLVAVLVVSLLATFQPSPSRTDELVVGP